MTLLEKQQLFTKLISEFILWCEQNGYKVTLGDSFRDPRLHGTFGVKLGYGAANSFHKLKLAQDLNLFIEGVYKEGTAAHYPLGVKWKLMHPECTWGGDFKKPDGNHYSFGEKRF